jgi:hypothetical protein
VLIWLKQVQAPAARLYQAIVLLSLLMSRLLPLPQAAIRWRTRNQNVEVADTGGHGSVASDQITLAGGTYRIFAQAPAHFVAAHQLRLQNITDGTTILTGENAFTSYSGGAGVNSETPALLRGRFTLTATKVLELQHRCTVTVSGNGMGVNVGWGTEVYATVELFKEA